MIADEAPGGMRRNGADAVVSCQAERTAGRGADRSGEGLDARRHDFEVMNEEHAKIFGDEPPARSAVAVHQSPLGALVEIEAWVHLPGSLTPSGVVHVP